MNSSRNSRYASSFALFFWFDDLQNKFRGNFFNINFFLTDYLKQNHRAATAAKIKRERSGSTKIKCETKQDGSTKIKRERQERVSLDPTFRKRPKMLGEKVTIDLPDDEGNDAPALSKDKVMGGNIIIDLTDD